MNAVTAQIESYYSHLETITPQFVEVGSQGMLYLDASPLAVVEDEYGTDAYDEVRQRAFKAINEERGKGYRLEDLVTLDRPRSLGFVLFPGKKRRKSVPTSVADLRAMRTRLLGALGPTLARAAFPYIKSASPVDIAYAMAIHNPLVHPERSLRRAVRDARNMVEHFRQSARITIRERLLDVLLREAIVTAYQPIMEMKDRTILGFEALSRGPRGSGLEQADVLFGAADEHGLFVELDRLCRRRALLSSGRLPTNAKIFVNTLPATVRDPTFRGKPLIDFLDRAQVSPDRIVIEITEKLVIENYVLFREAMAYFTDLGMSFAVDDVGAGYSGLESIARLKPNYLKIDIALVRDVHVSVVNREMVKAIVAMGHAIGAAVIAEGIQLEEEAKALRDMGIDWGQGYLLARPEVGPEPAAT